MALTIIGIGFFLIVSPKQMDDYWYANPFKEWLGNNGFNDIECGWDILKSGYPLKGCINVWKLHIIIDCGRLSNLALLCFLFLPKWVGSAVASGCWLMCMYYSLRLARVSLSRSPWLIAVAIFCWSFLIDWSHSMGALSFQYNYIIPSGLMLWYIRWINVTRRKAGIGNCILVLIVGLIIGAWHEGFSVPVTVGGLAVVLLYRQYRSSIIYVALCAFMFAQIYLFLCPGFAFRMASQAHILSGSFTDILGVLISHLLYFITACWIILRIIKRGFRQIPPVLMFALVSGGVSFMLLVFSGGYRRIAWWADIISIVALLELLRTTSFIRQYKYVVIKGLIVLVLGGLSIVRWVYVDYYVVQTKRAYTEVVRMLKSGASRQIFADFVPITKLPLICLWAPDNYLFIDNWGVRLIADFYLDVDPWKLCIIPETLRNVTSDSGYELPGETGLRMSDGIIFCNASMIKDSSDEPKGIVKADIMMSSGFKGESKLMITKFVSDADGEEYFYLMPTEDNIKILFGDIVRIENLRSCW